jgi:hypothetical protein
MSLSKQEVVENILQKAYSRYDRSQASVGLVVDEAVKQFGEHAKFPQICSVIERLIADRQIGESKEVADARAAYTTAFSEFFNQRHDLLDCEANRGFLERELNGRVPTVAILQAISAKPDVNQALVFSARGKEAIAEQMYRDDFVSRWTPKSADNLPLRNVVTRNGSHRTQSPSEALGEHIQGLNNLTTEQMREKDRIRDFRNQSPADLRTQVRQQVAQRQAGFAQFPAMPEVFELPDGSRLRMTRKAFCRLPLGTGRTDIELTQKKLVVTYGGEQVQFMCESTLGQ